MHDPRQHPLFWRFPLAGTVTVSTGDLPTPCHVYDGHGVLITGHGNTAAVAQAFVDQDVFPVLTQSDRAVMGLFVGTFTDASLGAHLQLQAVALCASTPGQTIADDATAFLAAMATRPDLAPFCLHMWTDSAHVVAYHSEYLGLTAALAPGETTLGKRMQFRFDDAKGEPLATGDISKNRLSDLRATFALIRQMGLHTVLRLNRQPFAVAHLVNRKSTAQPRNGRARTITAADQRIITRFDPKRDRLTLSGPLAPYDFKPLCLEHAAPFRHVHLHPDT